ncbi:MULTISPECIES: ankyrin repeat domain-containing protein [unclassified Bacillus cereus group]|uniref:ankyrin repeat domain-containing protein n=1 Tax=unclassified Bacillus cereus group TaxID=2750818 RepID=UPI0022E24ACC|nr:MULTISPECIES: ankyrin repeat domain-containing protein [unclassified Bacillus cereus group]MDA1535777.1 ankyrin repeat domain-containing protein [Bacillus cereus group sp. TH254-2LC]MDA1580280.1 ankyrin repeat domain-containing protein [Bacillus cereus group sp. TH228LC]
MYSRRVIVCDGGMVKKTLSFIGAVVVRKQKILLCILLGLLMTVVACDKQEEPEAKPVHVKNEKKKEKHKEQEESKEEKSINLMDKQLLLSATLGDTETAMKLIQDGANINVEGDNGETPVLAATYQNHVETVKALIGAGANIEIKDEKHSNPLLYASREGYTDIVKVLINAGVNTKETTKSGGTALISASERGHVEVVKELLERTDIDVNYKNARGGTALVEAIVLGNGSENHKKVIQMLIDHGADVNMGNKENITPLQYAEKRGFKDIANMLRIAGANEVVQPQPQPVE